MGKKNTRDDAPQFYETAWTDTPADFDCCEGHGCNGFNAVGLMVGVSGTVVVQRQDDTWVTIPASILQPGVYWRGEFKALRSTSTAQDVMVFW